MEQCIVITLVGKYITFPALLLIFYLTSHHVLRKLTKLDGRVSFIRHHIYGTTFPCPLTQHPVYFLWLDVLEGSEKILNFIYLTGLRSSAIISMFTFPITFLQGYQAIIYQQPTSLFKRIGDRYDKQCILILLSSSTCSFSLMLD